MRPLLRRPRFEEKNKKENKIQHHFLDSAAKKKNKRKRCACSSAGGASKGIVEKASGSRTPLFFRGGGCRMIEYVEWWDACYLKSYCWKRSEKLWDHKQKQIQSACSQPPWKKSGFFVELLASFPWLHGDLPHTAHTVAERVVLCRGAWFWNKILQDAMAENLDKQWIRITGTRDAPALAPPALRRKK